MACKTASDHTSTAFLTKENLSGWPVKRILSAFESVFPSAILVTNQAPEGSLPSAECGRRLYVHMCSKYIFFS